MVSSDEDIHQSLMIILGTNLGERVMQASFGCGLKSHVYDNINESTVTVLKDLIARAILFYEPRVVLDFIDADAKGAYDGRLDFHLKYHVISTNARHNIVYPYYLREGTDVQL